MQNVQWYVSSIGGIDPDEPAHPAREVTVRTRYESAHFEEHVAGDEFTLWIPAALTDLKAIEREAYRQLREHLAVLGATLPGDRT
jgi:hypothetical protein